MFSVHLLCHFRELQFSILVGIKHLELKQKALKIFRMNVNMKHYNDPSVMSVGEFSVTIGNDENADIGLTLWLLQYYIFTARLFVLVVDLEVPLRGKVQLLTRPLASGHFSQVFNTSRVTNFNAYLFLFCIVFYYVLVGDSHTAIFLS